MLDDLGGYKLTLALADGSSTVRLQGLAQLVNNMVVDLRKMTEAERNAAFYAVYADLQKLIQQWVPAMMQDQANEKLQSVEGRTMLVNAVIDAYNAAEKVREAAVPSAPAVAPVATPKA